MPTFFNYSHLPGGLHCTDFMANTKFCVKLFVTIGYHLFYFKVVSILPPRCWRQQISWSYSATSRTFGLVAWRNTNKKVTLSGTHCPARGVMVRCYGCYANGWRFDSRLTDLHFFLCFFPGSVYSVGVTSRG